MNKAAGNAVKDFLESRDAKAPVFFDEISLTATAAMKKMLKMPWRFL